MTPSAEEVFQEQTKDSPRLLHILNGDSVRMTLEKSDVPGTLGVWADALHEGPVPADLSPEQFREVHARFWAAQECGETRETAMDMHRRWDKSLASFSE